MKYRLNIFVIPRYEESKYMVWIPAGAAPSYLGMTNLR